MEILLGRRLRRDEHVHHLDGNRLNNLPSNLQVLSASAHMARTNQRHPLVQFCVICGAPFLTTHRERRRPQRCCSRRCGYVRMLQTRRRRAP
jgi:hypothetical protein